MMSLLETECLLLNQFIAETQTEDVRILPDGNADLAPVDSASSAPQPIRTQLYIGQQFAAN